MKTPADAGTFFAFFVQAKLRNMLHEQSALSFMLSTYDFMQTIYWNYCFQMFNLCVLSGLLAG